MSKDIHIAASPLTGAIFAGSVLKDGRTWGADKKDVTIEALVAVAEHTVKFGKPVEISKPDGTLEFRIIVQKPEPDTAEKGELKNCLAKLKKLEVSEGTRLELRLHWDNDRHQKVMIPGDSPQAVIYALKELTGLLEEELHDGNI